MLSSIVLKKELCVVISILFVLMLSSLTYVLGANSVNIISPESKPYGMSYEQHVINFWKWLISLPEAEESLARREWSEMH